MGLHRFAAQLNALRHLLFVFALLFASLQALPVRAQEGLQQCPMPTQSCGCPSCGCQGSGPHCPAGFTQYEDYCLPSCPTGQLRYPGMPGLCLPQCHNGCEAGYVPVPLPYCPPGTYRSLANPNECVTVPPEHLHIAECPEGMNYSVETGQCQVTCPAGYYADATSGLCKSYWTEQCPANWQRDPASGQCLPPGDWPPNHTWVCLPVCPPGFIRDIWHPTRCLPPPPSCEAGTELVDGRCLPICDKGQQRDPYGYCRVVCKPGLYQDLRGQCIPITCYPGMVRNNDGLCEWPPTQVCDPGQVLVNDQCKPVCDQGMSRNSDGNCVPDIPPPVITCPQGQFYNMLTKQCDRRVPNQPNCGPNQVYSLADKACKDVPTLPHCNQDQYRGNDGQCHDLRVPNVPSSCPPLTVPDGNGGCKPLLIQPTCPPGTFMNLRTHRCDAPNVPGGNTPGIMVPGNGLQPPNGQTPPFKFNPSLLQQLAPNSKVPQGQLHPLNPAIGPSILGACPPGLKRDQNGRCV